MDKLLTTKEAAARLGVTTKRVYQFIEGKRLPAKTYGRIYLIDEKDLKLLEVEDRKPGRPAKAKPKAKGKKK